MTHNTQLNSPLNLCGIGPDTATWVVSTMSQEARTIITLRSSPSPCHGSDRMELCRTTSKTMV
eukprot:3144920-Amphidinium_carterae.1